MNDRFAPPQSNVADPEVAARPPQHQLLLATRLLWASMALGIPSFLYEMGRAPGGIGSIVSIAIQSGMLVLMAWVIVAIGRARNWARIVALLLTVLEMGILLAGLVPPEQAVIEAVCNWIAALLDVAAMVLLFMSPAAGWFKRSTSAA